MRIFKDMISQDDIDRLLEYHYKKDDRVDERPDVVSKHPRWNIDIWPQHIIENILDKILDYDYIVEETIFNQSYIPFRLHVDSADGNFGKLGDAVLIPLLTQGPSSTVFFDNFWNGPSTKFSRHPIPPFEYNLRKKDGSWHYVSDLRILLEQIDSDPNSIQWTDVDDAFKTMIVSLISARENQSISKVDGRTYDYTDIVNYDPTAKFPEDLHEKYLRHIPIENLHGLTFAGAVGWNPGDIIKFERTRLHSAGFGHNMKIGLTIFTRRA